MSYNFEEEKNRIREELIKQGYGNRKIEYQEFLQLYGPYMEKMSEKDFADILGVSYSSWQNTKNRGTRTTILKIQPVSKQRKQEIQEELRRKGFAKKSIIYQEFLELYEPYKQEMSEQNFKDVLEISSNSWSKMKSQGARAIILKTPISEQRKQEIQEKLRNQGYISKKITYQEFLELYELYKQEIKERDFAEILGINKDNLQSIKRKGTRTIILTVQISEERKQEIQEELKKLGYTNRGITYREILRLYENYKNEMSENDFREILGISNDNLRKIKNQEARAIILKYQISEKRKQEIKEELWKKGYEGKEITYQEFLKIYEPYRNEIKESDFVKILGISAYNLHNMKNKKKKAIILKRTISREREKEIQSELIQKGYRSKKITYQEFLELYKPYEQEMKEKDFAEVLMVSYSNIKTTKSKGTRAIILSTQISEERKEKIKEKLKKQGYEEKSVTYQEFLKIYEQYKNEMTEREFAEILGISYDNLQKVKSDGSRARILKIIVSEERKKEIQEILIRQGYTNKNVTYQELLELYKPYKDEMDERNFIKILGISLISWQSLKSKGKSVKILKTKKVSKDVLKTQPVSEQKKQEIQEDLRNKGYAERIINYEEFLRIYEPYRKAMKESEFMQIIGIHYTSWISLRKNKMTVKVHLEHRLQQRISYLMKESRYYSREEIRKIGEQYNLSEREIIKIIWDHEDYIDAMVESLEKEGKIFLGRIQIDKMFLDMHGEKLSKLAHSFSKRVGNKLHLRQYSEDIAQKVLIHIIENYGAVIINLEEEIAESAIERLIKKIIKIEYLRYLKYSKTMEVSLDENLNEKGNLTRYRRISTGENIQEEAEEKIGEETSEQSTLIEVMQECIVNGMDRSQAIEYCRKRFHLTQEKLLEQMTQYLEQRKQLRKDKNGNVYFGEDR